MKVILFLFAFVFSINAHAETTSITKSLKSLTDKIKQRQAPQNLTEQHKKPSEKQIDLNTDINKRPEFSIINFKNNWCKNVDTSATGPFDYKGVSVGDICLLPEALIYSINEKLVNEKYPFNLMHDSKAYLQEKGGLILISNVIAGEMRFIDITLLIDFTSSKIYVGRYGALICAADKTNNLSDGNSFRLALEKKYGKPSLVLTEAEELKAQINALENETNIAKEKMITVDEAKKIRNTEAMIKALRQSLKTSEKQKSQVKALLWDYDIKNPIRPYAETTITPINSNKINDLGGCDIKTEDNNDIGFLVEMAGTYQLKTIGEKIDKLNLEAVRNKQKNAPTPDL